MRAFYSIRDMNYRQMTPFRTSSFCGVISALASTAVVCCACFCIMRKSKTTATRHQYRCEISSRCRVKTHLVEGEGESVRERERERATEKGNVNRRTIFGRQRCSSSRNGSGSRRGSLNSAR